MDRLKRFRNILKNQWITRMAIFFILSIFFLVAIPPVSTHGIQTTLSSNEIINWEKGASSEHYFGMVESLNEQLYAYSENLVHTIVPKPENGHHQIPMVYMDVFIEEMRPDHGTYMIKPFIIYYKIINPLKWERNEVYSHVPLYIFQGVTFNRYHIGTFGFGIRTNQDTIYPYRTGIACYHYLGNQWVKVDSKESDLGWWFLDHYPYELNIIEFLKINI
jgi:hypothetical protein